MKHASKDDLVGLALGALEPRDERRVAKHARSCERCSMELRRLEPAVGALAESVEQLDPPDSLRQSLMATVHAEASAEPAAPGTPATPRRGLRGFLRRPAAALGATALLVAGAVGYAVRDQEDNAERIPVAGAGPA